MDIHLKIIKISFSAVILLLIAGISGGSFAMKDNKSFTIKQLSQTVNYLNYKLAFANINNKNLTATVLSIFDNTDPVIKNNNSNAKSIPVLLYHGVIENADGSNILLEDFKNQMFTLKKAGWQTITLNDFHDFMSGKKQVPDKSFLLTFDDGAKDSYYPVDPILKALDYKAVIFIITKYSVGDGSRSSYYLSSSELKRMIKSGQWGIQAHAKEAHDFIKIDEKGNEGHFFSNKFWLENEKRIETDEEFRNRIYEDFMGVKSDIEKELKINPVAFAYPFGDFGQNSVNFPEAKSVVLDTIKSVYPISFYQVWGGNPKTNYPQPDSEHFLAKRINVEPQWSATDLLAVLENSRGKEIPYYDDFKKDNGWQKDWGQMEFKDDSMIINAHASTTGSAVFLDGSYLWQDYVLKADVYLTKGQVFSLMARYKDGKNYVMCSFSDKSVRIEQFLNGERKILSEIKGDFVFIGRDRKAGIGVQNNTVNCYLDDKIAMKGYNLDQSLNHGGIGFKTWDPQMNNSELIVKEIFIEGIK